MMSIQEQKHLCQIYMSPLMNLLLKNQTEYRILFQDYRAGLPYLPSTNSISTFEDSNQIIIADFENDDVTRGTINGSIVNTTNLSLWSSIYLKFYQSSMLIFQPLKDFTGSALRFLIGRTPDGLVDYLTVSIFYENGTNDLFPVRVLPTLKKKVFTAIEEQYVIAVQTISLPLLSPIIGLEFIVDGTNAHFLFDNIVLVK